MRYIDDTIRARLLLAQKTLYNNANPSMEIIAVRPTTAIRNKDLWQEVIVTPGVTATNTSVAMRRTVKGAQADRAYVAYIAGGNLVVKYAAMTYPVDQMNWIVAESIANCTDCALAFDGSFVFGKNNNIEFITESTPWLFYVTSGGQLMAGLLGGTYESLVGSNVTSIDAIRGVASLYKDEDQGLCVFYVISNTAYYNQRIAGSWQGQESVGLLSNDIVDIRADRTFDWKIVLQVKDTNGDVYEVFTKMEASGWNSTEFVQVLTPSVNSQVYEIEYINTKAPDEYVAVDATIESIALSAISPVFMAAENIDDGAGNYGYKIKLTLSDLVFDTEGNESAFWMQDAIGVPWYCQSIVNNGQELILEFLNFNNATNPVTLYYTPGTVSSGVVLMDADSIQINLTNLVPYPTDPPEFVSAINIEDWEV